MASKVNFDITLANYSQKTGRYGLAQNAFGDVAMDGTQAYAVQTAVGCIKDAWWADTTLGSDLSTLKQITSRTPQQATTMVQEALDPLVKLNKISPNPTVNPPEVVLGYANSLSIDMEWTTPGGSPQQGSVQV